MKSWSQENSQVLTAKYFSTFLFTLQYKENHFLSSSSWACNPRYTYCATRRAPAAQIFLTKWVWYVFYKVQQEVWLPVCVISWDVTLGNMSGKNHPLNQLTTKSSVQTQVKCFPPQNHVMKCKQKLLKTGGRKKKYNFPFLPRDKLDPNVYPSSAKQPPLPASEFCTARCRRLSLCLWGQTPPATRSSQGKASYQKAKEQNPPVFAARGCIRCFLCPQSALWGFCTEISFLSLKATLRLHKTSAENSPTSPTLFFSLLSRADLFTPTLFTPCPL